ncbi:MAG: hypothetical protein RLZZ104_301, partial [Pseudomonadota bacterium]
MIDFWNIIQSIQHELLLFSAIWFLIGAADELLVDIIWAMHKARRWFSHYRHKPPLRSGELGAPARSGMIAIFIPAWNEAQVIGAMLRRCTAAWQGSNTAYRIYVGCYPNDAASIAAIRSGAAGNPNCRLVLCASDGPTTKADCLNRL